MLVTSRIKEFFNFETKHFVWLNGLKTYFTRERRYTPFERALIYQQLCLVNASNGKFQTLCFDYLYSISLQNS